MTVDQPSRTWRGTVFIAESDHFTLGAATRLTDEQVLYATDVPTRATTTGLVATDTDVAWIVCGTHAGPVDLTVEVWDTEPPAALGGWDDVAEASTTIRDDALWIAEEANTLADHLDGDYRLRVHAADRDAAEDWPDEPPGPDGGAPGEPLESFLLQLWPAPSAPDALLKATDALGEWCRDHASGSDSKDEIGVWRRRRDLPVAAAYYIGDTAIPCTTDVDVVDLTIELFGSEPSPPPKRWQPHTATVLDWPGGPLTVRSAPAPHAIPVLRGAQPGPYTIRAYCDPAADQPPSQATHLLRVWRT